MSQLPPGPDELFDDEMQGGARPNPLLLVHRALRGRYLLAGALGLVLAIPFAIVGYFVLPPEYQSEAVLSVNVSVPAVLYGDETEDLLPAVESFIAKEETRLRDDRVLNRVLGSPSLPGAWPKGSEGLLRLRDNLEIQTPRRGNLIFVRFTDEDPQTAQTVAQLLLEQYEVIRQEEEDRLFGDRKASLDRLKEQYERARNDARNAALRKAQEVADSENIADEQRRLIERKVEIEDEINELVAMRPMANAETGDGEQTGEAPGEPSDEELLANAGDPRLEQLIEERDYLRRQLDSLLRTATPLHRQARQLARQIEVFELEIDARREELLPILRGEVAASGAFPTVTNAADFDARLEDLYNSRDTIQARLNRIAEANLEIIQFRQQAELAESRLEETERRREALRVEMDSRIKGQISVAKEPEFPLRPSTDRRLPLAGAGFFGGLGMGFALVAGYGFAFPRVRVADDVTATAGDFAMLGMIPEFPSGNEVEEGISVREAFQFLRVLLDARAGRRSLICGITSPTAGDGKTTIAVQLARSFAATRRRVLLIDADLVGRGATRDLGVRPSDQGEGDTVTLRGSVVHLDEHGFDFIPASESESASEVFCGRILGDMVDQMRSEYDVVLVDTGPILGSIEAAAMTPTVDQIMLVVSRGLESRLLKMALDRLRELNARSVGLVFNRATTVDFKRSFAPPSSTSRRSVSRGLTSASAGDARRVMGGENGAADR